MTYSETLAETPTRRLRLVHDESPSEPYDDGSTPILVEFPWGRVEQLTEITSYVVDPAIIDAYRRFVMVQDEPDRFERYLRIFHGTTSVAWFWNGNKQVSFDTADWREVVGATDAVTANMDEWIAYCDGEVYGYVIEEKVTWVRADDGSGIEDQRTTWEEIDSCWGYYGYTWAVQAAQEAFEDATAA